MKDDDEKDDDKFPSPFIDKLCTECGERTSALQADANPVCPVCKGKKAQGFRRVSAVKRFEREVPPAYEWAHLDAPELAQRVRPAGAIVAMRGELQQPWVVFYGATGTGKTSLAVAAVRERVKLTGEHWTVLLAFRLGLARLQHRAGTGEAALIEQALSADCLLLDDVGQESMTAINPISDIINERDAQRLTTWITTGLLREQVGERYNGGVARRMFERSHVVRLGVKPAAKGASTAPGIITGGPTYDPAMRRAGDT